MDIKQASINYSLKNIPVPHRDVYLRSLINKTEHFIQRVRWKVFHFLNPKKKIKNVKNTFGFKTPLNAPQSKELVNFENDLTHLISNLVYTDIKTG